jgi:hypothetical protein
MARWGLLLNRHGTSLEKNQTSILVYVFTITFTWFVRAVAHLTVLEAGLKIQQFNKIKIRRFLHLITKLLEHSVVCEKIGAEEEMMLRQLLAYDCRSAKRFHVRRRQLVVLRMPR